MLNPPDIRVDMAVVKRIKRLLRSITYYSSKHKSSYIRAIEELNDMAEEKKQMEAIVKEYMKKKNISFEQAVKEIKKKIKKM